MQSAAANVYFTETVLLPSDRRPGLSSALAGLHASESCCCKRVSIHEAAPNHLFAPGRKSCGRSTGGDRIDAGTEAGRHADLHAAYIRLIQDRLLLSLLQLWERPPKRHVSAQEIKQEAMPVIVALVGPDKVEQILVHDVHEKTR